MGEQESHKVRKESRLLEKLKLNKFKLDALLGMTKAINNKLDTKDLLEIYRRIVQDDLTIPKLVLFAKSTNEWNAILAFGQKDDTLKINPEEEFKNFKDITVIGRDTSESIKGYDILIPVYHHESPLAYLMIGDLDEDEQRISPTIKHMNFVQTLTNILVVAVENKRLAEENLKQVRLQREVELAAEMQSFLVPNTFPSNDRIDMSGLYLPHQEVGGDYYDYIPLGNDRFVFCIADVSGKGIAAAFLMANFQAYLKSLVSSADNLKVLIRLLNKRVFESSGGDRFITFFIGHCDLKSMELTYVNAGHNPPVLLKNNEVEYLSEGCVGLGMLEEIERISVGTVTLQSRDAIVCFTDGLVEMENTLHEEFGSARIGDVLRQDNGTSMTDFNTTLFQIFNDFCQSEVPFDDIALLSLRLL